MLCGITQPFPGLGQDRSDRGLGNSQPLADFTVIHELEVIKPNDFSLAVGQLLEHPIDLFRGSDGLNLARGVTDVFTMGAGVAEFGLALPLHHFLDARSPGDHGQVGRQ